MYAKRYKTAGAETAGPGDLVVMLYDGILKFAAAALEALGEADRPRLTLSTNRAIAIVDYLQVILDSEQAPELVAALDRTYTHWIRSLARASAEQTPAPIHAILPDIQGLRDAWAEAAKTVTRDQIMTRSLG